MGFFTFFCMLAADRCILVLNPLKCRNYRIYLVKTGDEMVIKTEQDLSCIDIEIIIRYANMNKRLERLTALIQSFDTQIKCNEENTERYVNVSDIFYIESVDKRTFVYLDKDVFRTDYRLYQLAENLADLGFVQISKSCILNINALVSIKRLINSRMEATLKNGEKLHITRKYLDNIKRALQGETGI